MSFWTKIKNVKITDLDCFQEACRKNDIKYEANTDSNFKQNGCPVVATLSDNLAQGRNNAYLVQFEGNTVLGIDNDVNYSTLSKRLGKNGGILMRDYSAGMVEQKMVASGGFIESTETMADGSIVMCIGY